MQALESTQRKPWEVQEEFPEKPDGWSEHGYVSKGKEMHPCSRAELIDRCAAGSFWGSPPVLLVWAPETERLAAPEEVPFLHDALRRRARRAAISTIRWCAAILAAAVPLLIIFADSGRSVRAVLVFFLLPLFVALGVSVHSLSREIEFTAAEVAKAAAMRRYQAWLQTRDATYTKWLCGCLAVCLIFSLPGANGGAAEAAGLVKGAARAGEWWRLFTCSMLHANFQHFWMNALALLSLGRLVEAHAGRWHLPLVFLLAVPAGSLLSLALLPDQTSVGASGGLMGLVGFLAVLGYRRRAFLPPSFLKEILFDIGLIGLVGLVGYDIIDNAAHLGGLIGGALAGLLLVGEGGRELAPSVGRGLRAAGNAALAALVLTAAATIVLLFRYYAS